MKKLIFITAAIAMAGMGLRAQDISTDTLPCGQRLPHFYYSSWHDTANWYWNPDEQQVNSNTSVMLVGIMGEYITFDVYKQYVRDTIRVKGLWALVQQYPDQYPESPFYDPFFSYIDNPRVPEYLHLYVNNPKDSVTYTSDTSRFLLRVATVRWDTLTPKMMCFKKTYDDRLPRTYCYVYEVLFDTVITIQGDYWIGGTRYNCVRQPAPSVTYEHFPTKYPALMNTKLHDFADPHRDTCISAFGPDGPFGGFLTTSSYSRFGLITDTMPYVELLMDDTSHGYGVSAYYIDSTYHTITAYSRCGYRFSHWNDGDSTNPRTIFVTQDTTFTAYYDSVGVFNVSVRSNDTALGDVTLMRKRDLYPGLIIMPGEDRLYVPVAGNDSSFCERFELKLKAVAHEGARFRRWSDGSTDNQHTLRVTGDSAFVGYFSRLVLYSVTVLSNDEAQGYVTGDSTYYEDDEAVLEAVPLEGHRFVSWNDGVTDNPRRLVVTQDTAFTAIFEPIPVYTVTVRSSNEALGYTTGDSTYYEGDEAVLAAVPLGPNRFWRWNDGDTANPRHIIVMQDTAFTAQFLNPQGVEQPAGEALFRLLPNPTSGLVRCETVGDPFPGGTLTLTDATGRELMRHELAPLTASLRLDLSALPAGTYFVTLATPRGSSTQKLILE